ncbi:MAG: FUSC family protein [Acutalibacteraceae bacterium]|nr:FUSC family protein [Acutalibacteraceae bacterium]
MEHVELETLDRGTTEHKQTSPPSDHKKKPTNKAVQILKLIGTKTLLFAFIILFIVGFSALFGPTATYSGVCVVTALLMFLKLDIGIKHTQAPFVIFGLFVLTGLSAFAAAVNPWLGILVNFITVCAIMVLSGQRAEYRSFMPFLLCYIFTQSTPVYGIDFGMRIASLAAGGALVGIIYFIVHRKKPCPKVGILGAIKNTATAYSSVKTRFFLRMAIGMTIAMFIGDMIGSSRTLWLSLPILSLTQLKPHETAHRTVYRIFATIVGGIVYIAIFDFIIPAEYLNLGLLISGYIYTYITKYQFQQIFVVISALGSAHSIGLESAVAWPGRFIYLLIGVLIVAGLLMIDNANIWKKLKKSTSKENSSVEVAV